MDELYTYTLHHGNSRAVLVRIIRDPYRPGMWRVQLPGGTLSDIINLARARDAARLIAARGQSAADWRLFHWKQHQPETAPEAPPMRSNRGAVSEPPLLIDRACAAGTSHLSTINKNAPGLVRGAISKQRESHRQQG